MCMQMDNILGDQPASVPTALLDTGAGSTTTTADPKDSEEGEVNGK